MRYYDAVVGSAVRAVAAEPTHMKPTAEGGHAMAHVVATATCVTAGPDGNRVRLTQGVVWNADDPMVLYRPDLFRPLEEGDRTSRRPVEQATAAPGEVKRGPGRPRKKVD